MGPLFLACFLLCGLPTLAFRRFLLLPLSMAVTTTIKCAFLTLLACTLVLQGGETKAEYVGKWRTAEGVIDIYNGLQVLRHSNVVFSVTIQADETYQVAVEKGWPEPIKLATNRYSGQLKAGDSGKYELLNPDATRRGIALKRQDQLIVLLSRLRLKPMPMNLRGTLTKEK